MEILRLRHPWSCLESLSTEMSVKMRQTLAILSNPAGTKQIGGGLETDKTDRVLKLA